MQKKVKILRIQSRICIGGPAIHTEILSKYLNAEKYETILVGGALNNGEVSRIAELRQKGIHVQLIPEMGREISPLRDLFTIFKLYRLMQQEAPDIVHTHTAKAGAAGRIAACLARVPVIVHTFHGHVFHDYFGKLRTTLFIWLERILGTLTSSIITISPRQRFDIVEKYKIARPTKVKVIQLGFELERFLLLQKNVLLKNDLGLTQDEILIGIVGRLVPIKNHKMMLRVLEQLRQNGIKGHLCIVGDGELRNELELLAKEWRIQKYVHFLGWRLDVEHIYANLDLLALTSFNEGTPVAIIEAMASRIPVVATHVGGVPDLIEHQRTGLLCQVNDVVGMTREIEYLLAHSDFREAMLKNACESVVETYHYNRLVAEMESLYKNLLQNRSGAMRFVN